MHSRYTLTEQDYIDCARLAAMPTTGMRLLLVVFACFLLALAVVVPRGSTTGVLALMLVAGQILFFLLQFGYAIPAMVRRSLHRSSLTSDVIEFSVLPGGIEMRSKQAGDDQWLTTNLSWAKISRWRSNSHYLLIYSSARHYLIIPKRPNANDFDFPKIIATLEKHVGSAS